MTMNKVTHKKSIQKQKHSNPLSDMIEAMSSGSPCTNCLLMEKPGNELLLMVATHVKLNANNVAGITLLSKMANKNMNIDTHVLEQEQKQHFQV